MSTDCGSWRMGVKSRGFDNPGVFTILYLFCRDLVWQGGSGTSLQSGTVKGYQTSYNTIQPPKKISNAKIESTYLLKWILCGFLHQRFIFITEYHHYKYVISGFIRLPARKNKTVPCKQQQQTPIQCVLVSDIISVREPLRWWFVV